jgi:hypothetical protein
VAPYYDAWQRKRGDFSDVPLADDFEFLGPVASFDSAEGYRAMAREAGQAITRFDIRRQFVDGNTVCSIVDWEMAMPGLGRMTSAELLEVEDAVMRHQPAHMSRDTNVDDSRCAPAAEPEPANSGRLTLRG